MTIEDFRKLKTGDCVLLCKEFYSVEVIFLPAFDEYVFKNDRNTIRIKLSAYSDDVYVVSDEHSFGRVSISASVVYRQMERVTSEKEVLEIQLKEEQERIRQEIDTSNKKQEEIQKKLVELTLPQIGKMYEIHDVRYGKYAIGVLVSISANGYRMVIANKNVNYQLCNINPSQTKLIPMDSSTDNITKSILEFIKLGEQQ